MSARHFIASRDELNSQFKLKTALRAERQSIPETSLRSESGAKQLAALAKNTESARLIADPTLTAKVETKADQRAGQRTGQRDKKRIQPGIAQATNSQIRKASSSLTCEKGQKVQVFALFCQSAVSFLTIHVICSRR